MIDETRVIRHARPGTALLLAVLSSRARRCVIAALACAVLAVGCSGPLTLGNIQLGRSLNTDNSVGAPTTLFKPNDIVYVSVHTTARGEGTVGVRWKYGDRVIDEPTKRVSADGPMATEFHLQNSGVFPNGDYSVDILIDGQHVGTRSFKVDDRS